MEALRKRGKAKLRFRIMSHRVQRRFYNTFKKLFFECLNENEEMAEFLNRTYSRIQVYFFWETLDDGIELAVHQALNDKSYIHSTQPTPATAISKNGRGCILFFIKHLLERTQERQDIENIKKHYKSGVFEELCHLVEHNGDISMVPNSYSEAYELFLKSQPRKYWDAVTEIMHKLITDRNHYEVYLMMMKVYPQDWIDRYYLYFTNDADISKYKDNYEKWKKTTNDAIALARLIAQYLGNLATLLVSSQLKKDILTEAQKNKLDFMTKMGNDVVEGKLNIIADDSPTAYENLIYLKESTFQSRDSYFPFILKLWRSTVLMIA